METKKKSADNSGQSGSVEEESKVKTNSPAGLVFGGLWSNGLPYGHGAFLLFLLLTLLLGYALPYDKPELPQRDYRVEYKSAEDKAQITEKYEQKKEAYDEAKKAWDEGGEEARRGWIVAGRNLAKFSTVLWVGYCLIIFGLIPLASAIPKHFGKQLSLTLMPVLMLGVVYALAKLILDWIPVSGWPTANSCLLYTSPSPRDGLLSRMPSSA